MTSQMELYLLLKPLHGHSCINLAMIDHLLMYWALVERPSSYWWVIDGDMSREIQERLLDPYFVADNHGIISDTAFPVGKDLVGRIMSPLKEEELERAHPQARAALLRRSQAITSLRQACEWRMGAEWALSLKHTDNCCFHYLSTKRFDNLDWKIFIDCTIFV